MYREILNINKFYYFFFVALITILLTYCIRTFFVSEAVYFRTFSDTMTEDRIEYLFNASKSYSLIAYALFPVLLIIKVLYNSFVVTTGTLLENEDSYTFTENFNVCLKAEFVFLLMNITKILTFSFFKKISVLTDSGYIPFSLLDIFDPATLPKWAIYPLQTINIWEVLFCCLGAQLFAKAYKVSTEKAIALFCIPYIIGTVIILIVASFLTIQFT